MPMEHVTIDGVCYDLNRIGVGPTPSQYLDGQTWKGIYGIQRTAFIIPSDSPGYWHAAVVRKDDDVSNTTTRPMLGESIWDAIDRWGLPVHRAKWKPSTEYSASRINPVAPDIHPCSPHVTGAIVPDTGKVYFIATESYDFVKIGWAMRPKARLTELQTGCPHELFLLKTIPAEFFEEADYHKRFARFRHRGEWFRCEGELKKFVFSSE